MRNTREILRQKWLLKRPHRAVVASVGVSMGTVSLALARAAAADLTWEAVQALDDGVETRNLCDAILAERPHPEQGFRSCLGILRLGKRYGEARLEAACARALRVRARSYRHVESILKHGLDRVAATEEQTSLLPTHENVRGRDYYH